LNTRRPHLLYTSPASQLAGIQERSYESVHSATSPTPVTLLGIFAAILILAAADRSTLPAPPIAKKIPKVTEIHGRKLVDNYFWMRDKQNPEVKLFGGGERLYDAVMKPTLPLQEKLYNEMLSRIKEDDAEVPYKDGGYFYYTRTEAGKQYGIRCRKKGGLSAARGIVLNSMNSRRVMHLCRWPLTT